MWNLIPNPLRGLATTGTNVHDHQYVEDVENMTAKKTTNVLTAKETMALVLEIVRYERKKNIQNITYPEARRMVETTKYAEVTPPSKYPNNQKTKLLCVKQAQLQNPRW